MTTARSGNVEGEVIPMTASSSLHKTVAERMADQLRDEIRAGSLPGGQPLRQNDIAARFGVSSTPVREAFHILERAGLVERDARRGVRVFKPSISDLTDAYEVREGLESLAARFAAERATVQHLQSLARTMDLMHSQGVAPEEFVRLNAQFHTSIAAASGNARLARLVASEQAATASFIQFLGVDRSSAEEAHAEHAQVLEALQARDPHAASEAMAAHLRTRASALRARLTDTQN